MQTYKGIVRALLCMTCVHINIKQAVYRYLKLQVLYTIVMCCTYGNLRSRT